MKARTRRMTAGSSDSAVQQTFRATTFSSKGARIIMRVLWVPILVIGITASATDVLAWTLTADFESGTVGQLANGPSGFHWAGNRTIFSNARAHSGSKSARMTWERGMDGFSSNTGQLNFPSSVSSALWIRAYMYFESPWSWSRADLSQAGIQKLIRYGHSGGGHTSLLGDDDGTPWAGCEPCGNQTLYQNKNLPATVLKPDRWYSLEFYFNPSQRVLRFWIDGTLKAEYTGLPSGGVPPMIYAFIMSYWNGGAPQTQVQYIDDIVITTDTPSNRDAQGNPMIGPTPTVSDTTPPQPPTGLRTIN